MAIKKKIQYDLDYSNLLATVEVDAIVLTCPEETDTSFWVDLDELRELLTDLDKGSAGTIPHYHQAVREAIDLLEAGQNVDLALKTLKGLVGQ